MVTVGGEEGNIDDLAKSGIRPGDFCAPRIFVKAPCSTFQPELEILERRGRPHALRVEKCPITAQGTSLGTTGYVDDFACHLLGGGLCELDRCRPPAATRPNNPSWKGQTGRQRRTGTSTNEGSQAKIATDLNDLSERPDQVKQAEQLEGEWAAMQMED